MKILNLFAGIGGNRTLWGDKHEITAVESDQRIACIYHKRFPNDEIIIGDAYDYLLWNYERFQFIWASPPCQTHSWANNWLHAQDRRRYPDMKLWQLIVFLQKFSEYGNYGKKQKKKIYWVIENVKPYYEPFLKPSFIINRHYFWANFALPDKKFKFSSISVINAKGTTRRQYREYIQDLCTEVGIEYDFINELKNKNWSTHDLQGQILRNCVKPEVGKYILEQVLKREQRTLLEFS